MKLPIVIVNAFSRGPFTGNPAAVVVTETPLPDRLMQQLAAQNNLAETAFVVTGQSPYSLRWFTPMLEVDLCGHATLAAGQVLFSQGLGAITGALEFDSKSGLLGVSRQGELLALDFPSRPGRPAPDTDIRAVAQALGCAPDDIESCHVARELMVVLKQESVLRELAPDELALRALHPFAVMVTSVSAEADFSARFFAPNAGIAEDPVTGSAYCTLAPYWAARLNKVALRARQLSARGGWLELAVVGDRVQIAGAVETYLTGEVSI